MPAAFQYFPFDEGAGSDSMEAQWVDMMQFMRSTGIVQPDGTLDPTSDDLAVTPGTNLQVKVAVGKAFILGTFFIQTDDYAYLDLAANSSGDPRIDYITLETNFDTNITEYVIVEGTPEPSPVAPPLTQNSDQWQVPLATVEVANGATFITTGDIIDMRERSVQDGGLVSLTSAGGISLVSQAIGPDLEILGVMEGTGIGLSADTEKVTITNSLPSTDITIDNGTADEELVTGSNPNFTVKGISAGANIELTSDANSVTVTGANAPSDSPYCIITRTSDLSVTNASTPTVTWQSAASDPYSMWDSGATAQRITVPEDGYYYVNLQLWWSSHAASDGNVRSWVSRTTTGPTTTVQMNTATRAQGSNEVSTNNATILALLSGDYLTAQAGNFSGQTLNIKMYGTVYTPVFSVFKIREL